MLKSQESSDTSGSQPVLDTYDELRYSLANCYAEPKLVVNRALGVWYMCLAIISPVILSATLIIVPLQGNTSSTIAPWSYVAFQMIYSVLSYPNLIFQAGMAIPGFPVLHRFVIIPAVGLAAIFVIYFFLYVYHDGENSSDIVRAVPPNLLILMIFVPLLLFCLHRDGYLTCSCFSTIFNPDFGSLAFRQICCCFAHSLESLDRAQSRTVSDILHKTTTVTNNSTHVQSQPSSDTNLSGSQALLAADTLTASSNGNSSDNTKSMAISTDSRYLSINVESKSSRFESNGTINSTETTSASTSKDFIGRLMPSPRNRRKAKESSMDFPDCEIEHIDNQYSTYNDIKSYLSSTNGNGLSSPLLNTTHAISPYNILLYQETGPSITRQHNAIIGSFVRMWFRYVCLTLVLFAAYMFCQTFTDVFNGETYSDVDHRPVVGFIVFVLVLQALRIVAKCLAKNVDRYRTGHVSIEITTEIIFYCFYYVFYRTLFTSINSFATCIQLKSISAAFDALLYASQFTSSYHSVDQYLLRRSDSFVGQLYKMVSDDIPAQLIYQRVCMDYSIRFPLIVSTALSYIIFFVFIRFGYNSQFYETYGDGVSINKFDKIIYLVLMSVAIELVLYFIMDIFARRFTDHSLLFPWIVIFTNSPSYLFFVIVMLTHVLTDVYITQIKQDCIGGSEHEECQGS